MTLQDQFTHADHGDTITIPDWWAVVPKPPINAASQPSFGAPLCLSGIRHCTIRGGAGSTIAGVADHGNLLAIHNCQDILIENIIFMGAGKLTAPNDFYFALLLLAGNNDRITIRNCGFLFSGNHGIGALYGGQSNNVTIENCWFESCGNYASNSQKADGAAIAVGRGSGAFIGRNRIKNCGRGIEVEAIDSIVTEDWTITENIIQGCDWQSIVTIPTHGDASRFRHIAITNNRISGTGKPGLYPDRMAQCGVYVGGGTGIIVEGNHISDIGDGSGILVRSDWADCRGTVVRGNVIENCNRHSIGVEHGAHVHKDGTPSKTTDTIIGGNSISMGQGRGIYSFGDAGLINGNSVRDCEYVGIHAKQSPGIGWNYCSGNKLRIGDNLPVTSDPWVEA